MDMLLNVKHSSIEDLSYVTYLYLEWAVVVIVMVVEFTTTYVISLNPAQMRCTQYKIM